MSSMVDPRSDYMLQVAFFDLPLAVSTEADFFVKFKIPPSFKVDPEDFIAITKLGHGCETSKCVRVNMEAALFNNDLMKTHSVIFRKEILKRLNDEDNVSYRVVYFTKEMKIEGAGLPFRFSKTGCDSHNMIDTINKLGCLLAEENNANNEKLANLQCQVDDTRDDFSYFYFEMTSLLGVQSPEIVPFDIYINMTFEQKVLAVKEISRNLRQKFVAPDMDSGMNFEVIPNSVISSIERHNTKFSKSLDEVNDMVKKHDEILADIKEKIDLFKPFITSTSSPNDYSNQDDHIASLNNQILDPKITMQDISSGQKEKSMLGACEPLLNTPKKEKKKSCQNKKEKLTSSEIVDTEELDGYPKTLIETEGDLLSKDSNQSKEPDPCDHKRIKGQQVCPICKKVLKNQSLTKMYLHIDSHFT